MTARKKILGRISLDSITPEFLRKAGTDEIIEFVMLPLPDGSYRILQNIPADDYRKGVRGNRIGTCKVVE